MNSIDQRLSLGLFSDDVCSRIYEASEKILQKTGIEVHEKETLNLLEENGAKRKGKKIFIPEELIKETLESAPSTVEVFSRDGQPAMNLSNTNSYFGNGSDCINIRDIDSGGRRKANKADIEKLSLLCDSLDYIDFVMPGLIPSDIPSAVSDIHQFQATLFNTSKPIVFTSLSEENTEKILDIANVVAGGENKFKNKPFAIPYIEPTTPLSLSKEAAEKTLLCAKNQIPILFAPGPISGASAPTTIAGTLALFLAENLMGVVISQLVQPGNPVIMGGGASEMDMKTTITPYAGPTFNLINIGISEISQFLDLPVFGLAGCSDSKLPDEQAVFESSISCLTALLSGTNLIHDIGYIESGMTVSLEMLVINSEIVSSAKRLLEGVRLDSDHLALDVIEKVGPGGNFIAEEHTLDFFKKEHWEPELSNRENFESWQQKGKTTLKSSAVERTKKLLKNHEPEKVGEDKRERILETVESAGKA